MADSEIVVALSLIADPFKTGMKEAENALTSFLGISGPTAAALTAVGGALIAVAKFASAAGEELLQLSQKTGISAQTFQEWSVAMAQNRLGPEEMATGMRGLSKAMGEAQAGTGKGAEAFKALGINAMDAAGNLRAPDAVLLEVAEKFAGMKDGAGKADLAVDLFTRSGLRMIPFLNLGAKGIEDLKEQSYMLGAVLSSDQMKGLGDMDNAFDNIGVAMEALKLQIGSLLSDMGLTGLIHGFANAVGIINTFIQNPLKGLEVELVHLNVFLREAGVNVAYFMGGFLVTGGFDKLRAQINAIEADGKRMIAQISGDFPREDPKKKDTRAEPPPRVAPLTGAGGKAELKTQEEELKAELEGYKAISKEKELIVQRRILTENLDERHAVIERLAIRRDETASQILAIQKMLPLLEEAHKKEVAIAGVNVEKKQAADEAYKAKFVKYSADIQKLVEQGVLDEGEATNKIIALDRKMQEMRGKSAVDYYKLLEELRLKNLKDDETKAASLVTIGDMQLLNSVEMATRKIALIRAQIATLEAEVPSAARDTKIAEKHVDLEQQAEIQSNSFVKGWARGMKQFTRDSTGAFGQAQTMARDTASAMTNGFQGLFFDAMQGKFHSLKDTAASVLTFMQQMASKILAQWATTQMLGGEGAMGGGGGLMGMLGGLLGGSGGGAATAAARGAANPAHFGPGFAEGGFVRRYFSAGGPSGTDTIPAWLTPGEGVLSTKGMANLDKLNSGAGGGSPVHVHMTINTPDANSFRHSADQIMAQASIALSRSSRNQ
jgi:hypothetical protein